MVVQYQKSRDTIYENQFDSTKKRGGEGIIGLALNDITSIGQFLINLKNVMIILIYYNVLQLMFICTIDKVFTSFFWGEAFLSKDEFVKITFKNVVCRLIAPLIIFPHKLCLITVRFFKIDFITVDIHNINYISP